MGYQMLLVSPDHEYIVWCYDYEINQWIYENCVCEEFIEISRWIAEHAGDMVKGVRESAFMFEIN